ncbi:hypothetical protein BGX30_005318 [Mortierella sp. GBA39]|nr:hypothetical protein BGX30_005318 [Mortierella sp. GBA39]
MDLNFNFVQQAYMTDSRGSAVPVATAPNSRPAAIDKKSQDILAVLRAMSDHGFSIRSFLMSTGDSTNEKVRKRINQFYADDGPAAMVHYWDSKLESKRKWDATFAEAAIEVVTKRVQTDLNRVVSKGALRQNAEAWTRRKAEKFSLGFIRSPLKSDAKHLTQLLQGLIPKQETEAPGVVSHSPEPEPLSPYREKVDLTSSVRAMMEPQPASEVSLADLYLNAIVHSPPASEPDWGSDEEQDSASPLNTEWGSGPELMSPAAAPGDNDWEDEPGVDAEPNSGFFLEIVGSMLVFMRSQQSNYLQMMLALKARHQRKNKQDSFMSATSGTLVLGMTLGEERALEDPPAVPQLSDLAFSSTDTEVFTHIYSCHVFKVLQDFQLKIASNPNPFRIRPISPLKVNPTVGYEFAAMEIDQASIAGNMLVLEAMRKSIGRSKGSFRRIKMIVAGDHLTISRIISLQALHAEDFTPFDRLKWAIPVLQLFHMQMVLSSLILDTHYGNVSQPGSLASFIALLGRKRLALKEKRCYYTADEFLRIVFTAMVRQLFSSHANEYHIKHPEVEKATDEVNINLVKQMVKTNIDLPLSDFEKHSTTNANALLFIRDMVVYIEFCEAIKEGDIGRIEAILKRITIMFQAGKNKNYGFELLRLDFNIRHRTHATVGFKWSAMDYITPLIRLFHKVAGIFDEQFELPEINQYHKVASKETDFWTL